MKKYKAYPLKIEITIIKRKEFQIKSAKGQKQSFFHMKAEYKRNELTNSLKNPGKIQTRKVTLSEMHIFLSKFD